MRDVSYLPGAVLTESERATIDWIAKNAMEHGWCVERQGRQYVRATVKSNGRTIQVTAAVVDGKLKATRTEVIDQTNVSDQVIAWLELKGDSD